MGNSRLLMRLMWPRLSFRQQTSAFLTLFMGIGLTVFLYERLKQGEAERTQLEFEMDARTGVHSLQHVIDAITGELHGHVDLLAWRTRDESVNCEEICVTFASERRGAMPEAGWAVHLDPEGALVHRVAGNASPPPLPFDPGTVPGLSDVLDRARREGVAASAPFPVGTDPPGHAILLVAAQTPASADAPATAPNGYAGYVLGLKSLMASLLDDGTDTGLEYVFRYGAADEKETYWLDLSRMAEGVGPTRALRQRIAQLRRRGARDLDLHIADADWSVLVAPTLAYLSRMQTPWSNWVLGGGLLFSLLLAHYILVLLVKFAEVERQANERASALSGASSELARQIALRADVSNEVSKLSRAVECSPIGVVISRPDGLIEYVNKKAAELTGYDKEEMEGHVASALAGGHLDQATRQEIRRQLAEGNTWQGEINYRRKNGATVHFEISIAPILNPEKETCNLIILFSDISRRKHLEEQFLQSQKMEVIGRLAGGVVHDLSNMLTVILGCGQIVRSQLSDDDPLVDDVEEIIRVGEQAGALNRQLLAFARTRSHEAERVDLNNTLKEMDRFLVRTLGEDVVLTTSPGDHLGCITIDPGQAGQLIMNLAVNARDAMPGGGKLTIKTRCADPPPDLRKLFDLGDGDHVMLSVRDTGTGMTEEVRKHLFEPFFTTKAEGKGTGLGLSTVYGIVKQFNGAIEIESEPGRGSEFKIYFPCCSGTTEQEGDIEKCEAPRGAETVLVVEDDRDVLLLSATMLKGLGYHVLPAESGAEALSIAMRGLRDFDLLVTDVVMPEINGMELLNRLRKVRPDLKVIFTTGFSDHPVFSRGLVEENCWMLRKPFTRDSLGRAVRQALDAPTQSASQAVVS